MPPQKGQKQRRGDERRERILDAALELFADGGYRGTSLAAVADRVGITPPGILHHFPSKDHLLQAVIEHFDDAQQEGWEELTELGGIAALRRLPALASNVFGDERFTRLMRTLSAEKTDEDAAVQDYFRRRYRLARRWLADLIRKGQERGEIRQDIDPAAKAVQILAIQDGVHNQRLLDPSRVRMKQVYEDFIESLIASIAVHTPPENGRPGSRRVASAR